MKRFDPRNWKVSASLIAALLLAGGALSGCGSSPVDVRDAGGDAPADRPAQTDAGVDVGADAGTSGDVAPPAPDAAADRAGDAPTSGAACNGPASSNLAGVSLVFPDDRCSYTLAEAAAGIQLRYQVVVAANLTDIHPTPSDAGRCQRPDASGFSVGFSLGGGGQTYCLCDVGLCAPSTATTSPTAGTTNATIDWDGRNWSGPSDTVQPKGPPFPAGTYTLTLRATGTQGTTPFTITATRFITLTP